MAVFRKVNITFWSDSFIHGLTPESKYFYLYLMTNTRTTQCGIYEITIDQMCFETGYNRATIEKLIDQFETFGKIKYARSTNEIALKNWPRYNYSKSPKVKTCIENELKTVKNRVLIEYLYSMDTQSQKEEEEEEEKEEEKVIYNLESNPSGLHIFVKEGICHLQIHQQSFDKYLNGCFGSAYEQQKMSLKREPPISDFFKQRNGDIFNDNKHLWSSFKKLWINGSSGDGPILYGVSNLKPWN
jgi:hypothetical protein